MQPAIGMGKEARHGPALYPTLRNSGVSGDGHRELGLPRPIPITHLEGFMCIVRYA